jgi:anti-sigma regulatory factor (Ser/Thr protein kinase)
VASAIVQAFEPKADEVRAARRIAVDAAERWSVESGSIESVVGELAANAVLHARSRFTVALHHRGDRVLIEVADANPRLPTVAPVPTGAMSGRGLLIVERLSRSWGVRVEPGGGKVVWAEVEAGGNGGRSQTARA